MRSHAVEAVSGVRYLRSFSKQAQRGTEGSQQAVVEGGRWSWEGAGSRGRQQVVVGGSGNRRGTKGPNRQTPPDLNRPPRSLQ
jgi:hypothetical protein